MVRGRHHLLAPRFPPGSTLPVPRSLRLCFRLSAFVNARARSAARQEQSSAGPASVPDACESDRAVTKRVADTSGTRGREG
jgi:hypothetical protein